MPIRTVLSSLRFRLVLLNFIVLAPMAGMVFHMADKENEWSTRATQDHAMMLTSIAAAQEDKMIEGAHQLLRGLAAVAEVQRGEAAPLNELFADLLQKNPSYANIGLIDSSGKVRASAAPFKGEIDLSDRLYFTRPVMTHRFSVGEYELGRITDRTALHVGFPILDAQGNASFVLFASLGVTWVDEIFRRHNLPPNTDYNVIDENGLVLFRHPDGLQWIGKSFPEAPIVREILARRRGVAVGPGLDAVDRLFAFCPIGSDEDPSAYLSIGYPAADAYAPAQTALRKNLLMLGGLAVIAIAASWFVGGWLVGRHVTTLVEVTRRFSQGDFDRRVDVRGCDEISEIGAAFNVLAEEISRRMAEDARSKERLAQQVTALVTQRTREATLLNEMVDMMQVCLTLEEAYGVIGSKTGLLLSGTPGAVFILQDPENIASSVASWGDASLDPRSDGFPPEDCWALRRGHSHLGGGADAAPLCPHAANPAPISSLCIPLTAHGETFGLFHLRSSGADGLSEDHQRLAATIAESMSLALANLRLRDNLRQQSIRDSLTGLFNRRYLEESLNHEVRRATRNRSTIGLIMIDVDHFKAFNDTHGHAAGDLVLRELGRILITQTRGGDVAARYGGEEFTIVLPEATIEETIQRAEHLCNECRSLQLAHRNKPLGTVTLSVGAAVFPANGAAADALLRAADTALYRAKKEGRDRIVAAT